MPILEREAWSTMSRAGVTTLTLSGIDIYWQAIGEEDPRTRLLATVVIGGAYHHLEAREVRADEDGDFVPVEWPEDLEKICDLVDGAIKQFAEIEGRTYYPFMTPYG